MTLLQKWIAALRNGQYTQIKHLLRDKEGYCAEGVLCDVSEKGTWKKDRDNYCYLVAGKGHPAHIPSNILTALYNEGATIDIPPSILTPKQQTRIPPRHFGRIPPQILNDVGFSFAEIADLLEKANPELVNQEKETVNG